MTFVKNPALIQGKRIIIREWISLLPSPFRHRLFTNTRPNVLKEQSYNLSTAIDTSCCWSDTPEGHELWDVLQSRIRAHENKCFNVPGLTEYEFEKLSQKFNDKEPRSNS